MRQFILPAENAISANDNMPRLEHQGKEAPARPREDHLTQEQQRFAVPAPSFSTAPVSKATAEEPPELEDFLVSVPPRAQKPRPYTGYAAAPRIWEGDPPKQHISSLSGP